MLGARANAAWHAAVGRSRSGRSALDSRDVEAENANALRAMSTLDDEEADADADEDADAEVAEELDDDAEEDHIKQKIDFGGEDDDEEDDDEDDEEEEEEEEDDESEEEEEQSASAKPAKSAAATDAKSASAGRKGAATTDEEGNSSPELSSIVPPAAHPRGIKLDQEEDDSMPEQFVGNLAEGSDSSADEGEDGRSVKHRNRIGSEIQTIKNTLTPHAPARPLAPFFHLFDEANYG